MNFKKKGTAVGVLLASLASSLGGSVSASAAKSPSIFKKLGSYFGGARDRVKQAVGLAAAGGAAYLSNNYVYVKQVPTLKDSDGLINVPATARNMSQMYWSDPEKFADRLRATEFYKLYNSYKYGYVPLTSVFGVNKEQEDNFKKKLYKEMERRINLGEATAFIRRYVVGEGAADAVNTMALFIEQCIKKDSNKNPPVMLLAGKGGGGKSYLTEIANKYITGNDTVPDLSLTNKEAKDVNIDLHGVSPSYKDAAQKSVVIEALSNPNKRYQILRIDEMDKMKKQAVGSLLTPLQEGKTQNEYDKKIYDWTMPVVMTSNFEDHDFVSGWNRIRGKDKENLRNAYLEDVKRFGGEPLTSRIKFVAVYDEPLYEDKLVLVSMALDRTKSSEEVPNFYIKGGLKKEEKNKIYEKILDMIVKDKGKDSMREINDLTRLEAEKVLKKYYPYEVNFSGRKVELSLDSDGELIAELKS